MKQLIHTLALLSFTYYLSAQTTVEYIDPLATYVQASELFSQNENAKALNLLNSINENDSIFMSAILVQAEILMADEQYAELIQLCDKYINPAKEFFYELSLKKGAALHLSEKYDDAIKLFTDLLNIYPKNYLLKYNLGVAFEKAEKYDDAIKCYQESILYNPYYSSSHLNLGNLCYEENKLGQALLCWDTYLMLNPNGSKSLQVLIFADKAVAKKTENTPIGITISSDDESFKQIDQILNSQMALDKNYQIPIKIDVPYVRQNYALMEMLKTYSGNGGFWSDKYIPMFKKMTSMNYFDLLMYRTISSVDNKTYQKTINKEEKRIVEFVDWYSNEWPKIIGAGNNSLDPEQQYFYSSGGVLSSIESKNTGDIVSYTNGRVLSKGKFTNNNRTGHWQWFYELGAIKEEIDYDSVGNPNGTYIKYYENGNIKSLETLIGENYQGESKSYDLHGYITEFVTYKDDYYDGIRTLYHPLGEDYIRIAIPYTKGAVNGAVYEYFPNGNIKMEAAFINDERVESEKQNFYNGQLSYLYNYENGMLNGEYKSYYISGKLHQEGNYESGKLNGNFISYYETGDTNEHRYYLNGEYHGSYIKYNMDKTVNCKFNYNKGAITSYTYYNSNGEILNTVNNISGSYLFKGYYPNGNLLSIGNYDKEQNKTGLWNYYSEYGALISTEKYLEGNLIENDTSFYVNRAISDITPYTNGVIDGLYSSYFINGTLKQEGYYKNGKAERTWKNYYPDGTLSEELYYKNNVPNGYQYIYSTDGKLYSRNYNENEFIVYQVFYDTSGFVIDTINYFTEKSIERFYPSGVKKLLSNTVNGYLHGDYFKYYANGKVSLKANYFMGKANGNWKWFNDKGQITCEGSYENGEQIGDWLNFHDNGKISHRYSYKNGKNNGKYQTYNEDGILEHESEYFEDMLIGEAKYYCPEGNLQMVRFYKYDELIGYSYPDSNGDIKPMIPIESGNGEIITYFRNGSKAREFKLINGEFTGTYSVYYSNGQLESTTEYLAGDRVGKSINYYKNGQIKNLTNYLSNTKHGEYLSYYKNGTLESRLIYKNDELSGKGEYFNEDGSLYKEEWSFNGEIYSAKYY